MAQQLKTGFAVGDSVCLKSSPNCFMTVARIPSKENNDLIKPLQLECVWLDQNFQSHFSRFPVPMLQKAEPPRPIGFKLKNSSNGAI